MLDAQRRIRHLFCGRELGALIEPLTGRAWTRADARRQVVARTSYLRRLGVEPDDRVFLHFGNTLEVFADLLAIWCAGACAIPMDTRLTEYEVETLAKAARPKLALWQGDPGHLTASRMVAQGCRVEPTLPENLAGVADDDPVKGRFPILDRDALILFTSGTTGQPKGVVHTHRSLRARWITLQQSLGAEAFQRTLCLLPTHFGHGLICNCLFPWLQGNDLYVLPPFQAEILMRLGRILDDHEITFMSSVPAVWRIALKMAAPPKKRSLHRVFCGSAPLSGVLWREIANWTGARDVWNSYGITETGSWVAGTSVEAFEPQDGLIGLPWGSDIRVMSSMDPALPPPFAVECGPDEEGYIWLNTPALMKGYLDRQDLTDQVVSQGWFMTGDVGVKDHRGWLYLRGRIREEINKGGMKIHPADVDAVIERFPAAKDVCTFAYEDALYGEDVGVAVVLDDKSEPAVIELKQWARTHLAEHRLPRRWYIVNEIPRTSRGKVNRAEVARSCMSIPFLSL